MNSEQEPSKDNYDGHLYKVVGNALLTKHEIILDPIDKKFSIGFMPLNQIKKIEAVEKKIVDVKDIFGREFGFYSEDTQAWVKKVKLELKDQKINPLRYSCLNCNSVINVSINHPSSLCRECNTVHVNNFMEVTDELEFNNDAAENHSKLFFSFNPQIISIKEKIAIRLGGEEDGELCLSENELFINPFDREPKYPLGFMKFDEIELVYSNYNGPNLEDKYQRTIELKHNDYDDWAPLSFVLHILKAIRRLKNSK